MKLILFVLIANIVAFNLDFLQFFGPLEFIKTKFNLDVAGNPLLNFDFKNAMELFTPTVLKGLSVISKEVPCRVLNPPMYIKHGSYNDVQLYLNNSLISDCSTEIFVAKKCMCNETYSDISVIRNELSDGTAVVAANNRYKQIVISYRSTLSIQNVLDDFNFALIDLPNAPEGAKVHRGFYNYFLSLFYDVRKALVALLKNPKYQDYTVHLTGYSLGAGVSIIAIPEIHRIVKSIDPNRTIQNFAYMSPRVGNPEFARYIASFNIPVTRYIYGNDVVPHSPPRSTGFVHVGQEIFTPIDSNNTVICSQEYDEDPNCAYRTPVIMFSMSNHLEPFGEKLKSPPYC